jgi:uncharacterized protein
LSHSNASNPDRPSRPDVHLTRFNWQSEHLNLARESLRETLARYASSRQSTKRSNQAIALQAALKANMTQISDALEKLNHRLVRVAVFGLVSRGKSAVLNALLGQRILQTGPLNGVTQYPRSVYWAPEVSGCDLNVELIDTPGIDEVNGQIRADMAQQVAQQADLILFVISGDITRTEYVALTELQQTHKPLILIFNKTDLYPNIDRYAIYQKLQTLFTERGSEREAEREADYGDRTSFRPYLTPDDIVLVAAEPAPMEVRIEWPDGQITHEWEAPPAQIDELAQKLRQILNHEGQSLLALNALRQTQETERAIAQATVKLHQVDAEEIIWRFAKWKAIAIAANPIAILDLAGGGITDLILIRTLARLYGLPMTRYEAGKLLHAILWSSGGLLLGEFGSGVLLGMGKSAAAAASLVDSASGVMAYGTTAIAQASLAGYGTYRVGKAAQIYLEKGCTWGPQGANTVIQDILSQVEPNTVLYKLRRELGVRG